MSIHRSSTFGICHPGPGGFVRLVGLLVVGCLLSLTSPGQAFGQWQAPSATPLAAVNSSEIVVLKNGEVLTGTVTRKVMVTEVQTEQGSRLVLPRENVDFVCHSMDEAYWQKAATISATDVEGQVALFQWCLKHKLTKHAENQFDLLMHADIDAATMDSLNRQLLVEISRSKRRQQVANTNGQQVGRANVPESSNSGAVAGRAFEPPATVIPGQATPVVRQVGYEQPASEPFGGNTNELTSRQLERELDALPNGFVGEFRRYIEPVLMDGCFAARCHDGRDSSGLELLRMPGGNPKRYSQRNLYGVLSYLRHGGQPDPIWRAATQPHAGQAASILQPSQRQYQMLEQWLRQASVEVSGSQSTDNVQATTSQSRESSQNPAWMNPVPAEKISPKEPATAPKLLEPIGEIPSLSNVSPLRSPDYVPVDPYDPEIFNRQQRDRE